MLERFCKACSKTYIPNHYHEKFCSNECRTIAKKTIYYQPIPKQKRKCVICGKQYIAEKKSHVICGDPECKRLRLNQLSREKRKKGDPEVQKEIDKRKREKANLKQKYREDPIYRRKVQEANRQFRENNREKIRKQAKALREKIKDDPVKLAKKRLIRNKWNRIIRSKPWGKVRDALSTRLNKFVSKQGTTKKSTVPKLIGMNKKEFIKYLESKFYNHPETNEIMSWQNYGAYKVGRKNTWHIDHIIPFDYFRKNFDITDIEVQKKMMHWSNLRPLWALENLKKNNKLIF